jgi:hypothetical protein
MKLTVINSFAVYDGSTTLFMMDLPPLGECHNEIKECSRNRIFETAYATCSGGFHVLSGLAGMQVARAYAKR